MRHSSGGRGRAAALRAMEPQLPDSARQSKASSLKPKDGSTIVRRLCSCAAMGLLGAGRAFMGAFETLVGIYSLLEAKLLQCSTQ